MLQAAPALADGSEDLVALKRASRTFEKRLAKSRRGTKTWAQRKADRAVVEATATGSPLRIDDETKGIPLVSTAKGAYAGELNKARGCYICKQDYTLVDAFYHWLCPQCAAMSHAKRDQHTDLTGKRALLTGGRSKIGMYIALRLLRDGAHTTITTRFPKDAARRFAQMEDAADWIDRLKIVGIDLRDPTQVMALADDVAAAGPLDILINNAAQTVRRSPSAYSALVELEDAPLPTDLALPEMTAFDRISQAHPAAIAGVLESTSVPQHDGESPRACSGGAVRGLDDGARAARREREPRAASRRDRGRRGRPAAGPADHQLVDRRRWTRSRPSRCSRCSCATRPRRSC